MKLEFKGRLHILVRENGKIIRDEWNDNQITNDGLDLVRDLLGTNNTAPTHIAVGTDNTGELITDTTLGTEVFRNVITRRIRNAQKIIFQLFLATGDANGNALVEAGIFNRFAAGDMLSRVTFAVINKTAAITAVLSWELTLTET